MTCSPVGTFWALFNKVRADAYLFVLPLHSPLLDVTCHDHGDVFFPFFDFLIFFPILLLVSLLCSFLTFLPPHNLACAIPVTITNSRCREMDEQIRLMDQNLKCLSAAEEKVLTIEPTERLYIWCGFVWFCFVLQLPPLHWLIC